MPVKEFDINEYIASLNLSEEDKKAVAPIFARPEVVAEVKRGWNSKAEGSALMNEVSTARTAAEAEKAEALRIQAETVALDKKNKDWAEALRKYETDTQRESAERLELLSEKTAYEAYLQSIGVDPAFALEGKKPITPPAPKEPPPVNDPKPAAFDEEAFAKLGYVKREEVGRVGQLLADLPFEVTVLNQRHMELYGKPISAAELQAMKGAYLDPANTRPLTEIAAERLHFADREKEMSEQAINERVKKEAEEMFTKRMSELQIPGATLDHITAQGGGDQSSAIHFASKGFAENGKGGGAISGDPSQVSEEELQLFIQANEELATKGIRATPY